jgi:hypothetical protein
MTKHELLAHLAEVDRADGEDLASVFGIAYPTGAMALLRLVRQGLARRFIDSNRGTYAYRLTDHGYARLAFFNEQDITPTRQSDVVSRRPSFAKGDSAVKRKKLHSGIYHCPACYIEFDLVAEESLKCDQCQGPLDKGSLDEVWDDSEDQDDD